MLTRTFLPKSMTTLRSTRRKNLAKFCLFLQISGLLLVYHVRTYAITVEDTNMIKFIKKSARLAETPRGIQCSLITSEHCFGVKQPTCRVLLLTISHGIRYSSISMNDGWQFLWMTRVLRFVALAESGSR